VLGAACRQVGPACQPDFARAKPFPSGAGVWGHDYRWGACASAWWAHRVCRLLLSLDPCPLHQVTDAWGLFDESLFNLKHELAVVVQRPPSCPPKPSPPDQDILGLGSWGRTPSMWGSIGKQSTCVTNDRAKIAGSPRPNARHRGLCAWPLAAIKLGATEPNRPCANKARMDNRERKKKEG
jgi:hypothetical protein